MNNYANSLSSSRRARRATVGLTLCALLLMVVGLVVSASASAEVETITYLHTDHLGSPILARDEAGNTLWQEDYGPWGEQLTATAANPADVGYTGHYNETELNLTYAGARWYDPEVGRFLSPDPVGYLDGGAGHFNRYVYAANNPYLYMDPGWRDRAGRDRGGRDCGAGDVYGVCERARAGRRANIEE